MEEPHAKGIVLACSGQGSLVEISGQFLSKGDTILFHPTPFCLQVTPSHSKSFQVQVRVTLALADLTSASFSGCELWVSQHQAAQDRKELAVS